MITKNQDPLRAEIYQRIDKKGTDELLKIWRTGSREKWSGAAFDIVEEILLKRLGRIPTQESAYLPQTGSPKIPWPMITAGVCILLIAAAVAFFAGWSRPSTQLPVTMNTAAWTASPAHSIDPTATIAPTVSFTQTSIPNPTLTLPETERINELIVQLKSDDENVSKAASAQLSLMGEKLSEEHVLEIAQIMRTNGAEWKRFLRKGPHCTYYEYTTTQYYAADALLNMRSVYINAEITTEATNAKGSGIYTGKVDDPGWI